MDRRKKLKAIVFDYNGTLVDDVRIHAESYWLAGREMGFDLSRETVWRHISQPPSQKRVLYYGKISDERWDAVFDLKKKYYYELALRESIVFADTAPALTELSKKFRLAVLSNTFRFFFEDFFPQPLAGLFETSLFFDEVESPKPSPEPLRIVLERLGIHPSECCYVGDAVEDVQMAKAAGAHAFSVATGGCDRAALEAAGARRVFDSLSEMAGWMINSGFA